MRPDRAMSSYGTFAQSAHSAHSAHSTLKKRLMADKGRKRQFISYNIFFFFFGVRIITEQLIIKSSITDITDY
jgi:hypothetical protein